MTFLCFVVHFFLIVYDRITCIFKLERLHLHCSNQCKNVTEKRMKLLSFCFGEIVCYNLEMLCGYVQVKRKFCSYFELDHGGLLAVLIYKHYGLNNNLAFCTWV